MLLEGHRKMKLAAKTASLWVGAVFLLLFPCAPVCLSQPADHALSATEIIHLSTLANSADWRARPDQSFREDDVKTKIDSGGRNGAAQAKAFEVMMIEGSPYERLIGINNEPLGRVQQHQEEIKLHLEINRRQNESPAERQTRISKYQSQRAEEHLLMDQMAAGFHFRLNGEQTIEGTNCYVLDALPNPDYRPPVERARVLTGMKGRLWIDKAHYHWVRVQAEVISPVQFGFFIAKVKPGTRFELEQAPVADVWLPKCFTVTVNATVLGLYGMRSKEEVHYSDYHQSLLSAQR